MLNDEPHRVVNALLNHRTPHTAYHSNIGFTITLEGTTWEQQKKERQTKEREIRRLLVATFPTWTVEEFTEHPLYELFPGQWSANISLPGRYHSLLSLAYLAQ